MVGKMEEEWGGREEESGLVGKRDGEWQLDGWNCRQKGGQRNGWKDGGRVVEKEGGWTAEWAESRVEGDWKSFFTAARLVCSGNSSFALNLSSLPKHQSPLSLGSLAWRMGNR